MLSKYFSYIFVIFVYCDLFATELLVHGRMNKCRIKKNVSNTMQQGKIVGGKAVDIKAYPFAVQFINMGILCGGMILNSWTVITAAHCFQTNNDTELMVIEAGARYVFDSRADIYDVLSFVTHENYNQEQAFSCDIALVFVESPMMFGPRVKKGILVDHDKWMNELEKNFIVTGWGFTTFDGVISNLGLLMARLRYISQKICSKLHNDHDLTEDMFCLYGEGIRDTCQGDSGGGVLWQGKTKKSSKLVGITSHGEGCAIEGKPSVYTNLFVMRDWIMEHVYEFVDGYCENEYRFE